jgi:chloride channel protein, CIC family
LKKKCLWKNISLHQFRHSLAGIDALPQLSLLGAIIGVCAGGLIILFRLLIEIPLTQVLPLHSENFEALPQLQHFLFPFVGSLIIAACFYFIPKEYQDVSVCNVLERFHNFQGRMHIGNLFVQFFGGIMCLISGQSVGREGPAVHIGASTASLLGQWLKLPNNSLRTLIACGVAAAIAASFNTPIAGVIFAMEVVIMSYSIVGFIPVMMASVCGAFATRLVFGEETLFTFTGFRMNGLWELSLMLVAGFIIGIFATGYMRLQLFFNRLSHYPLASRIIAAGFITGCLALLAPEILGLGYDTINLALESKIALSSLVIILVIKIIATSFSISMGLPGGLIGPQLFIGACLGAIIGHLMNGLFPDSVSHSGFYILLGMAAMMGAVINAPLAALMAVLELTYNPSIIFPSMLIIVVACITTRQLFKCEGIFIEQLSLNDKLLASSPTQQTLSNIGVRSVMQTAFVQTNGLISQITARDLLLSNPLWIVISTTEEQLILLRAADLASYIHAEKNHLDDKQRLSESEIDLLEIAGERLSLQAIHELDTLYQAQQILAQQHSDALYVTPQIQDTPKPLVLGIITRNTIDNHYKI